MTEVYRKAKRKGERGECIHCGGTGWILDQVETTLGELEDVGYLCNMCGKGEATAETPAAGEPEDTPESRRERPAWRLFSDRGGEIARISEHMYSVPSQTRRGVVYTVDSEVGSCTCPDRQHNGNSFACKHELAARVFEASESTYEIRRVHNSRLCGHFDNTEWHLVEFRGDEEIRTVSVSYSRSGAYLDGLEAAEFVANVGRMRG